MTEQTALYVMHWHVLSARNKVQVKAVQGKTTHRCLHASSLGLVSMYVRGLLSVHAVKCHPFSQWLNLFADGSL